MPISRGSFIVSTLLLLLLGLVALAGVVASNVWLVQRTQSLVVEVQQMRRLRAATVDFRSLLQDLETGQRGYLLTSDPTYLTPFRAAMQKLPAQIETFERAAQVDPVARQLAPDLIATAKAKMAELQQTVDLTEAGQLAQAVDIVRGDTGKELMDRARDAFAAIIEQAEKRLLAINAEQASSANALWWVSVGGGLLVLAVTVAGMATIFVYLRQLAATRREIEELNASLEERVRERTFELGRANDEIQRFAYIVTHDLRAPLVNIMGFTSELEQSVATLQGFVDRHDGDENTPDLEAVRLAAREDLPEALGFIRSSTRKMDGLINAILKLSREGRRVTKPERIDLPALLNNSAAAIQHQVTEAQGEVTIDARVPSLVADRLSVEQIIGNLLDNAVKYRRRDEPLRISIRATTRPGGLVDIAVEDNGRGIDPGDHERVFELFRRSGPQDQPGEGIGLAHVRTMARNLGGDISLKSTFGQGSVFTLSLPAYPRAVAGSVAA
ncbi:sensor histidine kinase [Ancylobacter sp. SL191]|uniref:sensor histidine kinase n=1 Tax=Ancylobacter sp. SL191 TaxID=2995166 RepID=UPI00226E902B|nr:CHASE3 domain-containing protein [Ancylobacter sp. SL191]WAC27329.1 CHASE3 domain-containing protein [Ancylobacter sp. SL191]